MYGRGWARWPLRKIPYYLPPTGVIAWEAKDIILLLVTQIEEPSESQAADDKEPRLLCSYLYRRQPINDGNAPSYDSCLLLHLHDGCEKIQHAG